MLVTRQLPRLKKFTRRRQSYANAAATTAEATTVEAITAKVTTAEVTRAETTTLTKSQLNADAGVNTTNTSSMGHDEEYHDHIKKPTKR